MDLRNGKTTLDKTVEAYGPAWNNTAGRTAAQPEESKMQEDHTSC